MWLLNELHFKGDMSLCSPMEKLLIDATGDVFKDDYVQELFEAFTSGEKFHVISTFDNKELLYLVHVHTNKKTYLVSHGSLEQLEFESIIKERLSL